GGVHAQKQRGYSYVGVSVTVGRIGGEDLVEAARLAELYGDGELRLATDQNFILSGVADSKLDYLLEEPLLRRHSPFPGPFERGVLACTGSEFCRFAIVETKARAAELARYLDNELAESPTSSQRSSPGAEIIRLHFSGCSASCAQPQIADIGLRGETAHVGNSIVEAVDIGLGGSLGTDARFSDWVEGALPIHELKDALVRLVRRHRFEMSPGEQFHEWVRRTPVQELRKTIRGHDNPERIDTIDISDT
ncbi:MAG: ferredoxin--nitrite reductase, partial [Actinobacteria bacterium]|nr:ferredoxin--nitrite reductase [Actinomycetota bacterium]